MKLSIVGLLLCISFQIYASQECKEKLSKHSKVTNERCEDHPFLGSGDLLSVDIGFYVNVSAFRRLKQKQKEQASCSLSSNNPVVSHRVFGAN